MNETWRVSPSFPDYEVSDLGHVRRNGRLLKGFFHGSRYCVAIHRPRSQAVAVATLVAEAFLKLPSVHAAKVSHRIIHRNDSLIDNRPANLLVVPRRKYSVQDYERASEMLAGGVSARLVRLLTGVSYSAIRRYRKRTGRRPKRPPSVLDEIMAILRDYEARSGAPASTATAGDTVTASE